LYNIGFNNGARDIARVDAFKGQVESLVADLHTIGGSVHQTAQMIEDNSRLAKEVADAAQENKRLTQAMQSLEQKVAEQTRRADEQHKRGDALSAEMTAIFPAESENVTVEVGHAQEAIKNTVTIGLREIYGTNSFVDASVGSDGEPLTGVMHVGDRREVFVGDRKCAARLMSIERPKADFMVTCRPR
jgi:hypothetical protein